MDRRDLLPDNKGFNRYKQTLQIFRYELIILAKTVRFMISSIVVYFPVSCTIMQKNGAGLHLAHACYWDIANDNNVILRWPNEKRKDPNARMNCIVTVFGLAM